ncbi:hypothetical protein E4U10_007772 [Claviceps purpurea]|nr:hypothetical protein E4U10_007772 [Claviceps purpurea]KAG6203030.1 hypothetical protein E4U50_005941 [Claviceps purpurea]KAG6324761.1 hypothetical protein E4U44_000092 [Claviceps purpurea]
MKARIIENPKGVDAAKAIMTLRARKERTSDCAEKHSLLELVPGMYEYGTSEEVESEKDGPRKD